MTKEVPYVSLRRDPVVILAIMTGQLPEKKKISEGSNIWPAHYHEVWKLCEECWSKEPSLRPKMDTVIARLKDIDTKRD